MLEGYGRPSFGAFLLRVGLIALAIFLFVFIVWGLIELADGSGIWSAIIKIFIGLGIVGAIGFGVVTLVRFFRTNAVTLNVARIVGLILGVLLLGFIIWGVIRLAGDNSSNEVVKVDDTENSTVTLDVPESETADEPEPTPAPKPKPTPTPSPTRPTTPQPSASEPLPNTGIEDALLPALSLGMLAYAAKSYTASNRRLKQN